MRLEKKKYNQIVYIAIYILLLFIVISAYDQRAFYYDSGAYWALGQSFWSSGTFSLQSYPITIRGYFFPFVLGVLQKIGLMCFNNPYVMVRLFYSILTIVLIRILLPHIVNVERKGIRYEIGCIVALMLTFYFWKDTILYCLSDLPALFLYALGIVVSSKVFEGGGTPFYWA